MEAIEKTWDEEKELAWMEIREFISEGIEDIKNDNLLSVDEVFTKLESKFGNAKI